MWVLGVSGFVGCAVVGFRGFWVRRLWGGGFLGSSVVGLWVSGVRGWWGVVGFWFRVFVGGGFMAPLGFLPGRGGSCCGWASCLAAAAAAVAGLPAWPRRQLLWLGFDPGKGKTGREREGVAGAGARGIRPPTAGAGAGGSG